MKKIIRKRIVVLGIFTALVLGIEAFASSTQIFDNVSSALAYIHQTADPVDIEETSMMNGSFELRFEPSVYSPLVIAMSNRWHDVLSSLDLYATNRVDRMLIANTGWWYGEDEYIDYVDELAKLVCSNRIDAAEFDAFEKTAWKRHSIASVFCRRYDEANVSNIVLRVMSFSGRSNHWSRVLSGEAKRNYENQVADGLWR